MRRKSKGRKEGKRIYEEERKERKEGRRRESRRVRDVDEVEG